MMISTSLTQTSAAKAPSNNGAISSESGGTIQPAVGFGDKPENAQPFQLGSLNEGSRQLNQIEQDLPSDATTLPFATLNASTDTPQTQQAGFTLPTLSVSNANAQGNVQTHAQTVSFSAINRMDGNHTTKQDAAVNMASLLTHGQLTQGTATRDITRPSLLTSSSLESSQLNISQLNTSQLLQVALNGISTGAGPATQPPAQLPAAAALTASHGPEWAAVRVDTSAGKWGEQMMQVLQDRVTLQAQQNVQEARIRLDPPDLGKLDLLVRVEGDRLSVQINANSAATREALMQVSERLRAELQDQNFLHVDVNVGSDHAGKERHTKQDNDDFSVFAARDFHDDATPSSSHADHWLSTQA
ncbi:flagellar hook-length control protein FliK [Enterovibrio sp. FF113]|uniref:flagellar hook-length control protein FliK n=1 Tax=Enterovibrio sp. FF113 TaxID=3230010 RepID=UPI00352EA5BD